MNCRTTLLAVLLSVWGCGGAPAPTAPNPDRKNAAERPSQPRELPASVRGLPDSGWRQVTSRQFRFRVWLPDAAAWREVDDERWFTLVHPQSDSTLRFRTWKAPPRVSRAECREQVYLWRGALRPEAEPMVEARPKAPEGYDVGLRIDLFEGPGEQRRAVALVVGATVRRCYAATYETSAGAPDSANVLAERLRLVSEGVFDRVELIGLDELAPVPLPE